MSNPQFQGSSDDVSLSPGQAKFLYWFVGTAPILKAMTPITTYRGIMKKKLQDEGAKLSTKAYTDVYRSVLSDFSRQTVTCSFQLMSYFIVGDAIKAILKKVYSKKSAAQQDPGFQQVLMQAIPLTVQVIATILSRNFGAADLQSVFEVNQQSGNCERPANGKVSFLREKAIKFIDGSLRKVHEPTGELRLRPLKAAVAGTGAMMAYFGALVGVLYGTSTLLEKVFPGTFKSKHQATGKNPVPATPALPAPPSLNVESRNGQLPAPGTPFNQPAFNMAHPPAIQFSAAHPLMGHPRVSSPLGYSR
jgi:hypothetical protein